MSERKHSNQNTAERRLFDTLVYNYLKKCEEELRDRKCSLNLQHHRLSELLEHEFHMGPLLAFEVVTDYLLGNLDDTEPRK